MFDRQKARPIARVSGRGGKSRRRAACLFAEKLVRWSRSRRPTPALNRAAMSDRDRNVWRDESPRPAPSRAARPSSSRPARPAEDVKGRIWRSLRTLWPPPANLPGPGKRAVRQTIENLVGDNTNLLIRLDQ